MSPTYNDHFRQVMIMVTKSPATGRAFLLREVQHSPNKHLYYITFTMSRSVDWTTLKTGKPTKITTSASGFTYTATETGFLYVGTACGNGQYATIKLNGTELARTKGPGGYTWSNTPVFVTPGDVVAATTSDNGANAQITASSFVPIH